ncbi:hypothetical protein GQ43DRAFT_214167 [Delitschia confertaspora ATCC 74209]|uniref:Uncharacterized protein n=1 Tax=Delitschia confertaspora ATCC 74209 TaxID=1513339 RepID=A0A9P4JHJ4_9PLEO|nr:hypothetical protein GQ43DRAFT_214167 [Delitschia confertaspora ATCC 74209]
MYPLLRGNSSSSFSETPLDKQPRTPSAMARPYTPTGRSSLSGLEDINMDKLPRSSPFSDYYTDFAHSPEQDLSRLDKPEEAVAYLFLPDNDTPSQRMTDTPSQAPKDVALPRFGPMPWMIEPTLFSSSQLELLSRIYQIERWISQNEPNEKQIQSLLAAFEAISTTLIEPESQTRQPVEELLDSGIFMSSDDGRNTSSSASRSSSKSLSKSYSHEHNCVPGPLLDDYTTEVLHLAQELRKRFYEVKDLNQLALDRIKMHEDLIRQLRKDNKKKSLAVHLDYSELVYLKLEIETIKSLARPQSKQAAQAFHDAVGQFELNWRNTERRIAARVVEDTEARDSYPEFQIGEQEIVTGENEEDGQEQKLPSFVSRVWGTLGGALDEFGLALGFFASVEDDD